MADSTDAKSIFWAAVEKAPAEREAFLEEACGGDAELRRRVEALLKAHDEPDSFLEKPAVKADPNVSTPTVEMASAEGPGMSIGPYKLLQQIGEGGMGAVYLAEQTEPVRRKVALKIIKPGMDSRQVIARFEAERQALALMEHQNIARVLDAGTTPTGRPYFVMELVKGVPITEYCDSNQLTPRERLELFIPVCQAIQHAHQKGVIHRDIKPSNVLVCLYDGRPVPKVIDFGVAKAIEQRLTEKTMFTQHGQIVGTLEYMSPEQAEMSQLDIDTRSDIYSLGVLLYELLTGSTPITKEQLREAGFTEMLRLIRETEPDKPSLRLSRSHDVLPSVSAQRRTEPAKLGALLRGELDWIVMTALEKDRTRRYETASAFAADVQRYLDDEAVQACPPSRAYKLRKLARKHRVALAMGAAVALILVAATAISGWQAQRAMAVGRELMAVNRERMALLEQTRNERNRATVAEADVRNQLQVATRQRVRAERAEEEAKADRDRALDAERQAEASRQKAIDAVHVSLDSLSQTLLQNARSVLATNDPGRRWEAIEMLRAAESLRERDESWEGVEDVLLGERKPGDFEALALAAVFDRVEGKPSTTALRTQAVKALLMQDGRVTRQWGGHRHGVSPDGRFVATSTINVKQGKIGLRVIDVESGNEVASPRLKPGSAPLVTAVTSGGQRIAVFSIGNNPSLDVVDVTGADEPRTLTIPGPSPLETLREQFPEGAERNLSEAEKKELYRKVAEQSFDAGAEAYRKQNPKQDQSGAKKQRLVLNVMLDSLRFSSDGRWLMGTRSAGGAKSEILLWDLRNDSTSDGRVVATIDYRPQIGPAFSPDSRLLSWIENEGTVVLWNLATGEQERRLELPYYLDGLLAFTHDGARIVAHGRHPEDAKGNFPQRAGAIVVWDVAENGEAGRFPTGPGFMATAISVSPDDRRVVAGQVSGELLVFDVANGSKLRLDHGSMPMELGWTPDRRWMISAGIGVCKVWDLTMETPLSTVALEAEGADPPIARFAVHPNGRAVAVERPRASAIELYDLETRAQTTKLELGRRGGLPAAWLFFGPKGKRLVRIAMDRVLFWDIEGGGQPQRVDSKQVFQGPMITSAAFLGKNLLLAGFDELHPAIKEARSGDIVWKSQSRQPRAMPRLSRDGTLVAFHSEKQIGRGRRTIEIRGLPGGGIVQRIPSARDEFNFQTVVDVSPDNRWLIEIELATEMLMLPSVNNPLTQSITGNLMGGTDESWRAAIFHMKTGERHFQIEGDSKTDSMAFSPEGRYFAVSQRNGLVVIWDVDERRRLFEWRAWQNAADVMSASRELVFTADGRHLCLVAEKAPAIRLLDLAGLQAKLEEIGLGWE